MEYKDHKDYTDDWVTLLTDVQLVYTTIQQSTTGKTPSLVEKGWNPLFPVDHLKRNLLTIHPESKDFHDMWKKACEKSAKYIDEEKNTTNRGVKNHTWNLTLKRGTKCECLH
ncbi:hypothetical protein O181_003926 [Austropuccinia psidii MF-1]|uniref:Uncharacterized protein n=1 Tax=Austropuccinia psidii MF-1 TaxID=1389203 RepID=A0A9Q3BFW8_9BASI|nr:hypothetical protein [Austropuccinia psidii MF-1]